MKDKVKTELTVEQARTYSDVLESNENTQLALKVVAGMENLEEINRLKLLFQEEEPKKE